MVFQFAAVMTGVPASALEPARAAPTGAVERAEESFRRIMYAESTSLTDAFLKLDRDRSGGISPDELARVFAAAHVELTPQELQMIISKYDANKDGKIDFYELAKMLPTNSGPLGGGRLARGQAESKKRPRGM